MAYSRRSSSREIFTIARRKENKNGKTFWKGVIDMKGQKVSITVYPSESGDNAKISAWPWTRNSY